MSAGATGARVLPLGFASLLMQWQRKHGRSGLPWQHTRDPYRVWLSEVMLQQTQVATVRSYFCRFVDAFPTVQALAGASADEVMALWAGLGYYSRARNLHRCAQVVVREHGGVFPLAASALAQLPGIGASTAAAIAAFCYGQRVSIADGNVRRVLARLLAFEGDLAHTSAQRELWALAQALLPADPSPDDMTAYTQGLMDLGATVCLRSRPRCQSCPVSGLCRAHQSQTVLDYPVKTRRVKPRSEDWWLLLRWASGPSGQRLIWLERRAAPGIWAGLYCPPVYASQDTLQAAVPLAEQAQLEWLAVVPHGLTHRALRLHPCVWHGQQAADAGASADPDSPPIGSMTGQWVAVADLPRYGLPAPVRLMLESALRPMPSSASPGLFDEAIGPL